MPITTPIETIKFSEMTAGGDLAPGEMTPGLLSVMGTPTNVLFSNPWTFLAPGSTASRPAPSMAVNGRLRFNTDTLIYEYYDTISSSWVELSGNGTGTINAGSINDLVFYAADGTTLSPISSLANAVLITNGSSVPSLSTTLPTGLTIPDATITSSTAALTSGQVAATPINPTDIANKAYVDASFASGVDSITGTTNQVIASSPTGNVTLSLPQDIATSSDVTFASVQFSSNDGLLDSNGNELLNFNPSASSVNNMQLINSPTGFYPGLKGVGSDTDVGILFEAQGSGQFQFQTLSNSPITISSGTAFQHGTIFTFSNTAATRTVTFPDASGTIAFTSEFTNWIVASSTPITASVNTGYYITDASQVTITLPATAAAGSVVSIVGNGAGGWILQPGSGQTIQIIGDTANTSVTSSGQYDCIEVLCTVANTTWVARSLMSTGLTIV